MSLTFTKLFSSITESTIWCEPASTRIVWITLLAMANKEGKVWASVPGLANRARVSLQETETALQRFMSPDPYSRSPELEGRRVEEIAGGWQLVTYAKYREIGNPVRASLDMEGYVYFAGEVGGDQVKIGFSKNPWARIQTLRTTNSKLEILATEKATMAREKERHEEFKEIRLEGEWFSVSPTLSSLIQALSVRDSRNAPATTVVKKTPTVGAEAEAEAEAGTSKSKTLRAPRSVSAKNRKTLIPEGFGSEFSPAMLDWLAKRGETQVKAHLIHFAGYAKANGKQYADWEQAFQNAVREDWAGVRKAMA